MAQPLIEIFHSLVAMAIDADGVFPHVGIARGLEGDSVFSLAVSPQEAVAFAVNVSFGTKFNQVIVGLDRFTRAGQGTELDDVITAFCWDLQSGWRCGIIEYRDEPRIVKPWNWANELWTAVMERELAQLGVRDIATAH